MELLQPASFVSIMHLVIFRPSETSEIRLHIRQIAHEVFLFLYMSLLGQRGAGEFTKDG